MRILCSILLLALFAGPVTAQTQTKTRTRIAGVEIGRAFREFHLTKEAMKGFDKDRRAIDGESHAEEFSKLADEVKQAEQAAARAATTDNDARDRALRDAELKREEYRALNKALRESRNKRTGDLNRRLVAASRRLLDRVGKAAAEVGRERGYDLVVDTSGQTNTGMPVILYARKIPDLTNEVIARLNKDAPPVPDKPASPPADAASGQADPAPGKRDG